MNYYNREGNKISLQQWAELLKDFKYKVVKQDILANGIWVSTVWLGLNYDFSTKGSPLIFETMVFPKKGEYGEIECERYSTLLEAKKGHKLMCKKYENYTNN